LALFDMNVEEMPEFKAPDAGEYDATVKSVELSETKKNKDPMLVFTFSLASADPDVNGTTMKYWHVLPIKGSEYGALQYKSTRALCENLGVDGNPEVEDFVGAECRLLLEDGEMPDGTATTNIKKVMKA